MKKNRYAPPRSRFEAGFSLAELAIALVIIGLLLASAFIPLSTQVELRSISDTQRSIDAIREALIGFAQTNGRLPCPASGSIATGGTNAGVEQVTGNYCTSAVGVIPWSTLGVPETDSWGRRFTYRISPAFADAYAASTWATATTNTPASAGNQTAASPTLPCSPSPTPAAASFALCTVGDIAVFNPTESSRTASPTSPAAKGIPAIIISHGKNGYGAYQPNGVALPSPTGTHELANAGGSATATPTSWFASRAYYARTYSPYAATCSDTANTAGTPFCEFDDIVAWISPSTLIARMVSAGKLP